MDAYELRALGYVRSPLTDPADAPRQGDEGAPDAVLELDAAVEPAPWPGSNRARAVVVLTWLHLGDRDDARRPPRGDDRSRPLTGVFATRSPDRPNPIGLHRCERPRGRRAHGSRCAASRRSTERRSSTSRSPSVTWGTADPDLNRPRPLWHTREVA